MRYCWLEIADKNSGNKKKNNKKKKKKKKKHNENNRDFHPKWKSLIKKEKKTLDLIKIKTRDFHARNDLSAVDRNIKKKERKKNRKIKNEKSLALAWIRTYAYNLVDLGRAR